MRKTIILVIIVVLLGAGVLGYFRYRGDISFYVGMFNANRLGKQFYASYDHLTRDVQFSPTMTPRLDVYSPQTGANHPVLIFVHGGGWKDYDRLLFTPVAMKLLPEGFVVVIPDYTVYPNAGYAQMAQETAAVVGWTLENIARYGGDPGRVVIAGHSAGGHLVTLVAGDPRFLAATGHKAAELCGIIGMSGVYDIRSQYAWEQAHDRAARVMTTVMGGVANFAAASPVTYVRADLPPMLLIHGEADDTVPLSIAQEYAGALKAVGARVETRYYPNTGHNDYLFGALMQQRATVVADLADFVNHCGTGK